MSTSATVPMLFGTDVRLIPVAKVSEAKSAGGRVVQKMIGPDKTTRYIPADESQVAGQNGWRPVPQVPETVSPWSEFGKVLTSPDTWKAAGDELLGAGKGILSLGAPPTTTGERVAEAFGPEVLPALRMAKGEIQSRGKLTSQAAQQFAEHHPVLGAASTILAGIPIPGVAAMGAGINEAPTPEEALGRGVTDAAMLAVPEVAGKIVPPILRGIKKAPEAVRQSAQSLVGAGEKPVAKAVEKVAADRHAEVGQHFADIQKAKGEPKPSLETGRDLTPDEQVSRRQAIERGIERVDPEIKTDLEKTEKAVNAEANKKYAKLEILENEQSGMYQPRDAEGHIKGEPISVPQRLNDTADASLRGSETAPTIIKDIAKKTERGDVSMSYNDLQGYREEIGRELRKGSLPPDVFDAYKKMLPMIDEAMDEIAERRGLGKSLKDARNFYRGYAETFLDNGPVRKALDSTERGDTVKAFQGMDQTGIEALARYNPELAKRINAVRGLQEEAAKLPSEKPAKYSPPTELGPKPEINTQAERARLLDKWTSGESSLNKWQVRALLSGGIGSVVGMLVGHGEGLEAAGAVSAGTYAFGPAIVAKVLAKPGVVEWLTRPPAGELETLGKLPYADRIKITDGLTKVVSQAQRQGIRVSPVLLSYLAAASKSAPRPKTGPLAQSPIP